MKTTACTLSATVSLCFLTLALPGLALHADVPLTKDGQPVATIVLGTAAHAEDPSTKALISNVKQMSGATLPVITEKAFAALLAGKPENVIFLGEGEGTRRLGISLNGVGLGGMVLKTGDHAIALLGQGDSVGAKARDSNAHAVFAFLEALGCRCLWPGELGKVVPHRPSITAPDLDVRFTPPVGQRNIRFAPPDARGAAQGLAFLGSSLDDYRAAKDAASQTEAEGSWAAWNGLGGNLGIVGGAAGGGLRGGWKEHGAAHPEWFALQADGTRDQSNAKERWRLCISNQGLIEHVANDIIARLNGHAQAAISLCPNDGGYSSFCLCPECQKLDAPDAPKVKMLVFKKVGGSDRDEVEHPALTDRFVHYWNAVVERVTKVVPDQLFLVEAYSYYSDPPVREKLHPNLVLRYVPNTADGWKGWQAAGAKKVYWRPNNLHSGYRDAALSPRARENSATLCYLAEHGMQATDMDSIYNSWATQGLHYYAMARLSWNPAQGYDAVLDDYCRSGFGAGAEQVKKYFNLAEKGLVITIAKGSFPEVTAETLSDLRACLVAAAKATEKDTASHRRVAFLRAGLEFTAISVEAHHMAEQADAGAKVDPQAVNTVMERRWQMMRALIKNQPLAVNVGVVAANDGPWSKSLNWKGPSELAKAGGFQLKAEDDWLNADQSATRK